MKYVPIAVSTLLLTATAAAQTLSGGAVLDAQCNGFQAVTYTWGTGSAARNGVCPGPGGSVNDASADWALARGDWRIGYRSTTDFRSDNPNGANAEADGLLTIQADDLVFIRTATPNNRDFVPVTLNFLVGVTQSRAGRSNCSLFTPNLAATFDLRFADGTRAQGSRNYNLAQGDTATGLITLADPIDGTLVPHASSQAFVQLTARNTFTLTLTGYTNVTYCGQPPAPPQFGLAASALRFRFPCSEPVFNLPPGITVNSTQLGIADNRWVLGGPACCPADFNGDGFLDFFDYADYVDCFENAVCPPGKSADFNADGFADFFDYADYVTAFETGC